jgi:dynein heavy chain 1
LESLKKEAAKIAAEMAKTDDTLQEISMVTKEYAPLATMTTRIFFTLDSLGAIHYLY